MIKVWGGIFIIAGLVGGCTAKGDDAPSVFPIEPTYALPNETEALFAAVADQDAEGVRAHLALWDLAASAWVVGDAVPLACAEGEMADLAQQLPADLYVTDYVLANGDLMKELWFGHPSGSTSLVLREYEGQWYLPAQSAACSEDVASPSPSPS